MQARSGRHGRLLGGSRGYSTGVVETVLGLIGLALFVVGVIAISAGVTWLVIKISPTQRGKRAAKAN